MITVRGLTVIQLNVRLGIGLYGTKLTNRYVLSGKTHTVCQERSLKPTKDQRLVQLFLMMCDGS